MKKITFLLWVLAALLFIRLLVPIDAQAAELPKAIVGENLVDKKPVTVALDPAKTYAVVFVSSKCPCSNSHVGELASLVKDYPSVTFVGIHSNTDEELNRSEEYFAAHAMGFPIVQDTNNALADAFGAFKTPHSYVIRAGEILYRGGVSDHQTYNPSARKYLREALEDLKQNRAVKTATTRVLGCAIPRS